MRRGFIWIWMDEDDGCHFVHKFLPSNNSSLSCSPNSHVVLCVCCVMCYSIVNEMKTENLLYFYMWRGIMVSVL